MAPNTRRDGFLMHHFVCDYKHNLKSKGRRRTFYLVKEVLHIRMMTEDSSLNRDGGVELHDCWVAAVKKPEQRINTTSST